MKYQTLNFLLLLVACENKTSTKPENEMKDPRFKAFNQQLERVPVACLASGGKLLGTQFFGFDGNHHGLIWFLLFPSLPPRQALFLSQFSSFLFQL